MSKILKGLSVADYIDHEDKEWLDKLDAIPGIKKLLAETIADLQEKLTTINLIGNGISITQESYPDLYIHLSKASKVLDIQDVPDFSVVWSYDMSMKTDGAKRPRIMAHSGAIDVLSDNELCFLLGHELGHIVAGHKPYHDLLMALYTPLMDSLPNAKILLTFLGPKILQWYRISDFTADRAGLLACQDIDVAITAMAKLSGVPQKYHCKIKPESFLRQAKIFEQNNVGLADSIIQNLSMRTATAPWLVVRVAKLYDWYESGEYHKVLDKYPHE